MRKPPVIIVLVALAIVHVFLLRKTTEEFKLLPKTEDAAIMLPAPVIKIAALDFHGIASDILFLNALVFVGSTQERKEVPRVKPWEWKWLYSALDASADLDPYFLDPYYFANGQLTWEALMIDEDNLLLEKGSKYRDWDSFLPFYIGFNYFYFLQDHVNARKWLLEASVRPDAPTMYASLATKLAYEKKRTENAIGFLEEMSRRTDDEALKKKYETRIVFLRQVQEVENAVAAYKKKLHRKPADIHALVWTGMLNEVPTDPYGGQLYLDYDGKVKSTSELQFEFSQQRPSDLSLP
jgi:hypothetical protein